MDSPALTAEGLIRQAEVFEEAGKKLREAAAALSLAQPAAPDFGALVTRSLKKKLEMIQGIRKKELYRFLDTRGPSTRTEIMAATEIPEGSLSNALKDEIFISLPGKKWGLREGAIGE